MLKKGDIAYFLGIGGIGMSALARYFNDRGITIYGYDLTETPLTRALESEGMIIHYDENPDKIPSGVDAVIYTPAIPSGNKELVYFKEKGYDLKKRSEILGEISKNNFTVAVAGTHGKTSISILLTHLLKQAGKDVTALVGGISKNYGTNYISSGKNGILVLEADEYDRSFLKLHPGIAIVSSVEADHLDIYGGRGALEKAFRDFALRIPENGLLVHHKNINLFEDIPARKIAYTLEGDAVCTAGKVKLVDGKYVFDLVCGDVTVRNIISRVPGNHYVENALAASAVAKELGVDAKLIKQGLESYEGVVRRFDYKIDDGDIVFIDDYAHHPRELEVTIDAIKKLYPGKKITGVFQPHLYSRTKDFAEDFARSLEKLDELILLEIYPAREKPMPGVTSGLILDKVKNGNKKIMSKDGLLKYLETNKPEVLLTLGAGDIGLMLDKIEKVLKKR